MCHYYYSRLFNDWNKGWNLPIWFTCVVFFVFYLILAVVYINYYHDVCFSVPAITTSTGLQLVQSKGLLIKSITIIHQTFWWCLQISSRSRPSDKGRGGGVSGGSSRPWDKRGAWSPTKLFVTLQASVWNKNQLGGGDLLGPSPGSAAAVGLSHRCKWHYFTI